MKVRGHSPSQEKIARLLSGIEGVPPEAARSMVSRAALVGLELDTDMDALRAKLDALKAEVLKVLDMVAVYVDPEEGPVCTVCGERYTVFGFRYVCKHAPDCALEALKKKVEV